jgi:hypothetical protein
MINYKIVIPTYKRSETIKNGTLLFLKRNNIPKNKIILFVANEQEKQNYKKYVPLNMYSGKIVIGVLGIMQQRNYIVKYFPENAYLISIDDDINDILINKTTNKKNGELCSISPNQLKYLFNSSYHLMKQNGAYIWGINLVSNPFMMSHKINTNLGIIPAGFYGWINRHSMVNKIYNSSREDVERSIMYFNKDQIIIRYMFITFKTNMRTNPGGIQANMNTKTRYVMEDKSTKKLKKMYSKYCCHDKVGGIRINLYRNKSKKKIICNKFINTFIKGRNCNKSKNS